MKNILVATDLKEASKAAFIRAIQLSQVSGATLHVLHVTERLYHPDASDEAARFRDETVATILAFVRRHSNSTNPDCLVHIEDRGRVPEKINQRARSVRADLIVLGRSVRPDVLPDAVFLTTGQVLVNASAPVLVATKPLSGNYRHILLEGDLSISPSDFLSLVCAFGAEGRLTLLVKSDVEVRNSGLFGRLLTSLQRRRRKKYVASVKAKLQAGDHFKSGISVDFVSDDYEAALASKLSEAEVDLVGLIRVGEKLRRQDSGIHLIAALQAASCDVLARAR